MAFPGTSNDHGDDQSSPNYNYQYPSNPQSGQIQKVPTVRRQPSSHRPLNAAPATPRMLRNISSSLKNSISSINDVNDDFSQSTLSPDQPKQKSHSHSSSSQYQSQTPAQSQSQSQTQTQQAHHSRNASMKRSVPPIDTNQNPLPMKPELLPPATIQPPPTEQKSLRSLDPNNHSPPESQAQPIEQAQTEQKQFHRKAIGHWDFITTIGTGSMGKVKLAKHNRTNEICAVKIVPRASKLYQRAHMNDPPPVDNNEVAKRAKEYEKELARDKRTIREGVLGRLLFHPYICRLYEMIPMTNHYYMLFEYVQGGQMLDYIVAHGSLKERHARKFARGIASALDYCHQNSVVHRDIKIENIMINKNGDIKIIDFGLSNLFAADKLLKTYCGSLYFAAPELLSAHPYTGPEVDIWSFGVVLYVLVCGKVPFDDPNVSVLHEKIKKGNVEYPTFLSRECISLLSRMLVVDPAQRATLKEVNNHPWIVKGFEGAPNNYMPLRFPLKLPLNPEILHIMATYDLGSETEISNQLIKIINSVEYQTASSHWYKQHDRQEYNNDKIPDPTNAYHPLLSIYYLVDEMEKRKRAKEDATKTQIEQIEQQQKQSETSERERLEKEKLLSYQQQPSSKPTIAFPEQAHTSNQQYSHTTSARPSSEMPPVPTQPTTAILEQQISPVKTTRPRANTHTTSEHAVPHDLGISKQTSFNSLLRKLSTKRSKVNEPQYNHPPLPKVSITHDDDESNGSDIDPMVRRGVSMKVTTKEKSSSGVHLGPTTSSTTSKPTAYKSGHNRAASASATHPANAKYGYTPVECLPPLPNSSKDTLQANNSGSNVNKRSHPSARAKSVGHVRRESINFRRNAPNTNSSNVPPLPNTLASSNHTAGQDDVYFDDVTLEDYKTAFTKTRHEIQPLSEEQIISQFEHAKPDSMPSIEYPRTLFLKGFFSVQTTSTKPLPVIRYNILSVLSKLGVKYHEVKGGFICSHIPSIEQQAQTPRFIEEANPKEQELYGDAFKSTTSSIDKAFDPDHLNSGNSATNPGSSSYGASLTATSANTNNSDLSYRSHRRKFSLGNTLLNYRKKTNSNSNLNTPQSPAPTNLQELSLHDESDDSLDSINGMGGSDMLISSRLEHRARQPTTPGGTNQLPVTPIKKSRTPLKFEIHIVKVPLVGLYGVQFKKVTGNTWMYKTLAGQILNELNL